VIVFNIERTLENNATKLNNRWKFIGSKLPTGIILPIFVDKVNSTQVGKKIVAASFPYL
jgi:hypothetical protein